jgi:TATA-box binding protein (TBP) (component of TFIID and TFIIIB)
MGLPTTTAEQYTRLRSYLNPYLKGPGVDNILNALAGAMATYLVNNAAGVNDQLYIATASGTYLDERLAQYGITRPPAVGLSDEIFSQIGIEVKNRKQVRDLINNLLEIMFGAEFTRASSASSAYAPYDLADGDTLLVNFDENHTSNIIFNTAEFQNIAAATAQEVADAITTSIRNAGQTGTAIAKNDGNGNYVELLSDTIGASSSVTVEGGSAQNELLFPAIAPAGGNMSTQWTLSLQPGGIIRFTWTAGANPNTGKISSGDYVNVFGGGFASSPNEGTYTIVDSVGGAVGIAYFEVENPLGTSGIVTQGTDTAVLFFDPVKESLNSRIAYAAVYQVKSSTLQIFIPATTQVIRRSRIGSAHLHYPPMGTFTLNVNPAPGDVFSVTSTLSLIAGAGFTIGATPTITAQNIAAAIMLDNPLLVATVQSVDSIQGTLELGPPQPALVLVQSNSQPIVLTITYTGAENIVASGAEGDPLSLAPGQQGPYMYDLTQTFTVSSTNTTLAQELDGTKPRVIQVASSAGFPNQIGYFILGYGTQNQEGPIPYIAVPSKDTILISPAYTVKNVFEPGTSVFLVAQNNPPVISQDGLNYPFYITDVVSGRLYAQQLIENVAATGINIQFTILYPNDIGLGKWGTIYSEIAAIYGP